MKTILAVFSVFVVFYVLSTECHSLNGRELGSRLHENFRSKSRELRNEQGLFPTCEKFECTGVNQNCNSSHICEAHLFCNTTAGTCQQAYSSGEECDITKDGEECDYVSSAGCVEDTVTNKTTCEISGYAGPGEDCAKDYQCIFGLPCENGKCKGHGVGELCYYTFQCDVGLVCNGSYACDHVKPLGANCTILSGECGNNKGCSAVNKTEEMYGICAPLYTKLENGLCSSHADCDIGQDLFCKQVDAERIGYCTKYGKDSNKPCHNDTECDIVNGETCECNQNTGVSTCRYLRIPSCLKNAILELNTCIEKHNCQYAGAGPLTCATKHCSAEIGCSDHYYAQVWKNIFPDCIIGPMIFIYPGECKTKCPATTDSAPLLESKSTMVMILFAFILALFL